MMINKSAIGIECFFKSYEDVWEVLKFNGIDFEDYHFSVIFENMVSDLPEIFPSRYFNTLISKGEIFNLAVFHLYRRDDKNECIDTYEDFLSGNCEMIILIADTCYVDIYCKNIDWLETIYKNAVNIPESNIKIKTRENDTRTGMYV